MELMLSEWFLKEFLDCHTEAHMSREVVVVEQTEKTTRVNMKMLQSRNKLRTLEKRMHST